MPLMNTAYEEDPLNSTDKFSFSEKSIRLGFIRKLYGILFCQLLGTFGMVLLFCWNQSTKDFVTAHPGMLWFAMAVMIACMILLACFRDLRRKFPMNLIFLGLFTVAQGFVLGCITSFYEIDTVILSMGITIVVVFALSVFAFQTKVDFTMAGGILMVCSLVLAIFGICIVLFNASNLITIIYASLGALLFSVYIVYDTQLIIGGNHEVSISPEEYIFAVLSLYMDVINIFINILMLVAGSRD